MTRHLKRGLFCGLGTAALSLMLWDGAPGAAAGEAANALEMIPPNEAEEIAELSRLATKLQDFHLPSNGLIINMVSFNVGVELGQVAALAAALAASAGDAAPVPAPAPAAPQVCPAQWHGRQPWRARFTQLR